MNKKFLERTETSVTDDNRLWVLHKFYPYGEANGSCRGPFSQLSYFVLFDPTPIWRRRESRGWRQATETAVGAAAM